MFIKFRSFRGFMLAEPIIVLAAAVMFVAYPAITQPHGEEARQTTCVSNQKQIALATMMYVQENDEKFPPVDNKTWELIDVGGKLLECPSNRNDRSISYSYNANLSRLSLGKIYDPTEVALTADSDNENSKMTKISDIALRHRKDESAYAIVAFTDGHVVLQSEARLRDIKFK